MIRALPLLLLAGCLHAPQRWAFINATPEQEAQAEGLIRAARVVTGAELGGGSIRLETKPYGLDGTCGVSLPDHVAGCTYYGIEPEIEVLIMPPRFGPDLTTTALPHELCHAALGPGEAQADACGALVVQEYGR